MNPTTDKIHTPRPSSLSLKKKLKDMASGPLAIRVRNLLDIRPTYYNPHPQMEESISDFFIWRNDSIWETYFDLFHIPVLIDSRLNEKYNVLFIFFDQQGKNIFQKTFHVDPYSLNRISISEILGTFGGVGTFAVFHLTQFKSPGDSKTSLVERGYVSYRRKTDSSPLRSYVHGNGQFIGCHLKTQKLRHLATSSLIAKKHFYNPQINFNDCHSFETLIVNPTDRPVTLYYKSLDKTGKTLGEQELKLQSKEMHINHHINSDQIVQSLYIESNFYMLRPIVFKFYESHFDVFHG